MDRTPPPANGSNIKPKVSISAAASPSRRPAPASPSAKFPPIKKVKKTTSPTKAKTNGKGLSLPRVSSVTFASASGPQELDSGEELEVLKCVLVREGYLQRLGRASTAGHISGAHLGETVDVLDLLRLATLETVEAVVAWRSYKRPGATSSAEPEQFKWNGVNYLLKLASDLEFLDKHTGLTEWLGFTLQRNPFILPLNLDCRAKLVPEQQHKSHTGERIDAADSNRFLQVGGKRSPSVRESLRNLNGETEKPAADAAALAQVLADRKRAKTPYETRVVNDEELVPNAPLKVGALRPKSRVLPRAGKTKYSSVLPSQIGEADMARLHEAEVVVLQEEAAFGRYARDIHGRVVPEDEAQRRFRMVELSGNAYNIPPTLSSSYTAEDPEGDVLHLGDPSQSDVPGKLHAKKRSGMLGPISKPEWRSFDRPPPPRRRARGAQLEEALAAERRANAQLGVVLDSLREEMERKAMDVAYFESCVELQVYSEELRTFTVQAQRELAALRRAFEEKKFLYESKVVNIHKKEELLNTFKAQHKAVKDASHAKRIESGKEQVTKVASLNQEQQRREDQERAASRAAAAAEQLEHDQAAPLVQHFCATQIQKLARGMLAREIYAHMKIEFVVSSTFIQAGVRGYLVRRRVAKMYWNNAASMHLQRAARGWLARRLAHAKRRRRVQEKSAERIQKVMRGRFGRVRMSKVRELVSWRLQLALAAQSVNAVALHELAVACQEMVALPSLMKTGMKSSPGAKPPLPALVLGLVRLLMVFTSDADDEWDVPSTRWREAARFLRCGVGVTRRMQKVADAAAGAARASMASSGGFAAAGVAASTPYLRESRLGLALLDAFTGDRDFRVETFARIPRGWQAAVAIFKWTTAFAAIARLQHLLEPSTTSSDSFLVVGRTLSRREAQHEVTERRDADHSDEELARRFVRAELVQAQGYPFHRPRPLLLVVANDVPQKARTVILEKLQAALPGLFLTITRPPALKRRALGVEDNVQAFDFNAIRDAVSLGYSVILEGDVGLRDVTQRAFLSCFATVKSGIHPLPMCVLLRGTVTNRSDLFGPKEGSDTLEDAYQEEVKRRMVDADVKLALDRTTRLRLALAEDAVAHEMMEQATSGFGDAPSPALVVVMEAVIALLTPGKVYEGPSQSDIATSSVSWRLSRRLLAQPAFLRAKLQQVDITNIPPMNLVALERYLRLQLWPNATVARSQVASSRLLFALATWVESAIRTARMIAADGTGFLAPEISRYEPVPGLFERVVVFDNCPVDHVQDGAGEDSAVMELLDAVLADVRVYRTAHLLVSSSVNVTSQAQKKKKTTSIDQEERCVVSLFHECRRVFASVYSPSSGQRWFTVISEDDMDKLLTPTAMPLGGEAKADKLPPQSRNEMYARLARLCLLQRRRLEDAPESIEPSSPYELVVRPHAVQLYRRVLLLGGYLVTVTIAELARGHVQVDAFVHGSNSQNAVAQAVALTLAVELENVLGRLSATRARKMFVPSPRIPSLLLDRLHLYCITRTVMVEAEFQPRAASALRLSVRTSESAPGRVLLRRVVQVSGSHHGAALGERWVFTLTERHEDCEFQAVFYAPGSSDHHVIRLSGCAAQELLHLSRHSPPSQLQRVLLRSFCLAESIAREPEELDSSDEEPAEDNADVISRYRLRRHIIARFPCVLRVMESPHQRITKKQVVRAYVQAELCDPEPKDEDNIADQSTGRGAGGDALRYRVWLPESCVQQTLLLQGSEIEASLPMESSWQHALLADRRRISRDLVCRYFKWDPNGGGGDNGCVVAHLPCGSFWATEVAQQLSAGTYDARRTRPTSGEEELHQSRSNLGRKMGEEEVSVVSCTHLLDDRETESDDEEDDEDQEMHMKGGKRHRKLYSYDTEELVHRGSYRANGLYVVVRVAMRAEVLRDLKPALASPTDRVRERDSFSIKFHVYHPASSGSAIAEIHGHRDLREVVGPDQASLIASTSIDSLMQHIILTRLYAEVDRGSIATKSHLKVTFLRDRLYAKQKATPVSKTFERDSNVNAAKLIDESRRHGLTGARGLKVLTTSKVLAGCGRTLLTVFDVTSSHRFGQGERSGDCSLMLRVDAYVCETSARLSLLLEGSDLVHIVGHEDKELVLPIVHKDANSEEIQEMERTRSRRLALMVLEYLHVEQRSDGRGDRLVLSDYSCSLVDTTCSEGKSKRLFKTVRAVGHDQVLLSAYLDGGAVLDGAPLSLRLELYDPASSSRCSLKLSQSTLSAMLGLSAPLELNQVLDESSRVERVNVMTHICSFLHINKVSAFSDGVVDSPASFAMTLELDEQRALQCMRQHIAQLDPNDGGTLCSWSGVTTNKGGNFFSIHLRLVSNTQTAPDAQPTLVCSAFAPTELLVDMRSFKWSDVPAEVVALAPATTSPDTQQDSSGYVTFFAKVCERLQIEIQHDAEFDDEAITTNNEAIGSEGPLKRIALNL